MAAQDNGTSDSRWRALLGREVALARDRYGYRVKDLYLRRVATLLGGIPKPALTGWAATLDLWALGRDGHTYILDWKTSGSVYVDHAVQLAAYANAEYAVANKRPTSQAGKEAWDGTLIEWGPEKAQRLGIVHVRPDGVTLHP